MALAQPGPGGPPAVGVVKVVKQDIIETSEFVGRIQSVNRVDLVARVTAFMTDRLFVEGSEVHAGDVLYKLERPPFEAQVASAAANVASADATLQGRTLTLNRARQLQGGPAFQRSTVEDAQARPAQPGARCWPMRRRSCGWRRSTSTIPRSRHRSTGGSAGRR